MHQQHFGTLQRLNAFWFFLLVCLTAAGILCIVASIMFSRPNQLLMNLIFTKMLFSLGIMLGVSYLFTVVTAIPAFLQPPHKRMMLKIFNWSLIGLGMQTLVFGTMIWLFSLQQRAEFSAIWGQQTQATQQALQDTFSCCGYWNGTAAGQFTAQAGFCADATFAANQTGCVTPITSAASPGTDFTLNNIFTSVYGFEAIIVCLFLATACLINEREVLVRFQRIDEKRGGGGFV